MKRGGGSDKSLGMSENPDRNEFDLEYQRVVKDILQNGTEETNKRTGHKTRVLPGAYFEVDNGFPLLSLRKIPIRIFVAEMIWYVMGSRMPAEFLQQYTRIWDDFTNINGVVTTSYGYRWRRHFGRDQLGELVKLLKTDPTSRHGVVVTWDPADDGLANSLTVRKKMNIPCPFTFVVNITNKKLNMFSVSRSTDMILGCPHDVAGFALLQRILAAHLGYGTGKFVFTTANAHIYDIHYAAAEELVRRKSRQKEIKLKGEANWLARAERGDDKLVGEIVGKLESQYTPGEPIKGLKIVI